MSCLIITGWTSSCSEMSFGGLLKIYLANKAEVGTISSSADGTITGITMTSGKFHLFEFEPQAGAALQEPLNVDGNIFVQQNINFNLKNVTQAKNATLNQLALGRMVAIVQYPNGSYRMAGQSGMGLRAASGFELGSGRVNTDFVGATISLTGESLSFSNEVSSTALAAVD